MFPRQANEWEATQLFCFLVAQTKKQTGKHLLRTQNVSEKIQKHRKQGNICVRNNVSATMFPRLRGP